MSDMLMVVYIIGNLKRKGFCMFCQNCGDSMPGDSVFCSSCGERVSVITLQKKKMSKKIVALICIGALFILALTITLTLLLSLGKSGYNDYNTLLEDYFSAFSYNNTNKIYNMFYPEARERWHNNNGGDHFAFLNGLDQWSRDYGTRILDWTIVGVRDSEAAEEVLESFDTSGPTQAISIGVSVEYNNHYDRLLYEFLLLQVNEKWHILLVWNP